VESVIERLVLSPGATYADVEDALDASAEGGWVGGAADLTPELGGEPTIAGWTKDGATLAYSANPAIGLRVLEGDGLGLVASRLPALGVDDAIGLVRAADADAADTLLGVTALGLLGDPDALPYLERLVARNDPELAAAAGLATRRIGYAAMVAGAARVAERRDRAPAMDPVLGLLRPVAVRRQVLRLFLADPPADRVRLLEVVLAGLVDPDWEVAWSAVLGAHDHQLAEALPYLRRCVPAPDRRVMVVLDAVREVAGHRLAGARSTLPGGERAEALLDDPTGLPDDDALLVIALRDPVPEVDDASPGPSRGFTRVPRRPHWLGRDETGIRRVRPPMAYDVATHAFPDVPRTSIAATLRDLGHDHGRAVRLPTSDELEMATRGPDGRRFPWGNAREPGWRRAPSAWGLAGPLRTLEWVDDGDGPRALPSVRHGCGAAAVTAPVAAVRAVVAEG
jgi:hypothetical protein